MSYPPGFLQRIMRWCCPQDRVDLVGDFLELYDERRISEGIVTANFRFFIDSVSLLPLKAISKNRYKQSKKRNFMFGNYFKIAERNLIRDKAHSLINITGLSVGLACAFIILLHVRFELSFDTFHEKADQIHRVQHVYSVIGAPIGPKMVEEYPEIIDVTRIHPWNKQLRTEITADEIYYADYFVADNNFFETFTFEFVHGDPDDALNGPESLVVTESIARKYFGDENPIGKIVQIENLNRPGKYPFQVSGVIKDVPVNSHLQFDHVVSFELLMNNPNVPIIDSWINDWIITYLVLQPGADPGPVEKDYKRFYENYSGSTFTDPSFRLMPMTKVRNHSTYLRADVIDQGNINHIRLFSVVAVLVLLIACINYMNMATARSAKRTKEVGLRKVMGAVVPQLITQFLIESVVFTFLALILALGLVYLTLPVLEQITGISFSFNILQEFGSTIVLILAITLSTGILAGSYPAFYLSSFSPTRTLKGETKTGKSATAIRKGLIIAQLAVSATLIVSSFVVLDQMRFVKNKNLGFQPEQVMLLAYGRNPTVNSKWDLIKGELQNIPGILAVASTSSVPGDNAPYWGYKFVGYSEEEHGEGWPGYYVGPNFLEMLGMEMIMGRPFSEDFETDQNAFILNESAWKEAINTYGDDWKEPIGRIIEYHTTERGELSMIKRGEVIGVVGDFHHRSLQNEIESLIIHQSPRNSVIMVKVDSKQIQSVLTILEEKWEDLGSGRPFKAEFLDDQFAQYYESESRFSTLIYIFCGLAILIASLGLFGLVSFTAQQRIKEIGIRKVLGASVLKIFLLITSDFFKLIIISLLISFPVAWYVSSLWLENFAYRINISWVSFILAASITALLSLVTISYKAMKASLANPVNSLRTE